MFTSGNDSFFNRNKSNIVDDKYLYLAFSDDEIGTNFQQDSPRSTSKFFALLVSPYQLATVENSAFAGLWKGWAYDYQLVLDKTNLTVQSEVDGSVNPPLNQEVTAAVYNNGQLDTGASYGLTNINNVTVSIVGNVATLTNMDIAQETGSFTITASSSDGRMFAKTVLVSKNRITDDTVIQATTYYLPVKGDFQGSNLDYTNASTDIEIYYAGLNDTSNWTLTAESIVDASISKVGNNTFNVTSITGDTASFIVRAVDTTSKGRTDRTIQLYSSLITDGIQSASAVSTKDSIAIPTDEVGNNGDYSEAVTTTNVYLGSLDDSNNWTYAVSNPSGNTTYALSNGNRTITISEVAANNDTIRIIASKSGYNDLFKEITIFKSLKGATGSINDIDGIVDNVTTQNNGSNEIEVIPAGIVDGSTTQDNGSDKIEVIALAGVTAGTATADKALVLDSSKSIVGIDNLESGIIKIDASGCLVFNGSSYEKALDTGGAGKITVGNTTSAVEIETSDSELIHKRVNDEYVVLTTANSYNTYLIPSGSSNIDVTLTPNIRYVYVESGILSNVKITISNTLTSQLEPPLPVTIISDLGLSGLGSTGYLEVVTRGNVSQYIIGTQVVTFYPKVDGTNIKYDIYPSYNNYLYGFTDVNTEFTSFSGSLFFNVSDNLASLSAFITPNTNITSIVMSASKKGTAPNEVWFSGLYKIGSATTTDPSVFNRCKGLYNVATETVTIVDDTGATFLSGTQYNFKLTAVDIV